MMEKLLMKRVLIYDVETKKATNHIQQPNRFDKNQEKSSLEKKERAIRTIHNVSILSKIVESIETLKLTDPQKDGPVVKDAVEKISSIVEEMEVDFKKDYWD